MRRANEIKIKLSIGTDVMYECDFPWMGTLLRNEENLINAVQRLEDPVSRIQEELFAVLTQKEKKNFDLDKALERINKAMKDVR